MSVRFAMMIVGISVVAGCSGDGSDGAPADIEERHEALAAATPSTVVFDGAQLVATRQALANGGGTAAQRAALTALLHRADDALTAGPWAVTDKNEVPPSGDKHDYLSQGPYWWASKTPTPDNPKGCPYVSRDGQRNPEADAITDHYERMVAWDAITDLSLAWFYTGNANYAARAVLDVRTWFLDPATRMNPSLPYAQLIPCRTDVRGTGIIDTSQNITHLVDALAILDSGAPGWTAADRSGMKDWFTKFLKWMQTSPQAKAELGAKNNHGSFIDMQNAAIALYVGQTSNAKSIVEAAKSKRIAAQIKSDGSQPEELSRTMSWHYANFNLTALGRLAEIGTHVGVDLWHYTAPNGANLLKAVDFLIPAAEKGASAWPYQQINGFQQFIAVDILHAAAEQANDTKAKAALSKVPAPPGGDLWPIRPSCTPLDPPSR
ncbi:alginate lyase family protein [Pendulispora rubella]|uniref:Alginate lyase family protein n=1 Tax=Pendulispora rubella TaxID=2741070 RepID=A0ABZ2LHM0_9BACT